MEEPTKETTGMTQTTTSTTVMMDFSLPAPPFRYTNAQKNHSLIHPTLPQQPPPFEARTTVTSIHQEDENNLQQPLSLSCPRKEEENDDNDDCDDSSFFFIVCADTQLGMTHDNRDWQEEIDYSKQAIQYMNQMDPPPLFCCVCGMYKQASKQPTNKTTTKNEGQR